MTVSYSLIETSAGPATGVQRSDGANIPADPDNTDWKAYQAWLAAGNTPSPVPPPTAAALVAYAQAAWQAMLGKGQTFNVAASGQTAVPVLCDGTNDTRADLALLALFGQANPSGTKTWLDNTGATTVLTGAELVTLATLAGNWVAGTYPALATLLGQIQSGAITTTAQIDAYAWPTV